MEVVHQRDVQSCVPSHDDGYACVRAGLFMEGDESEGCAPVWPPGEPMRGRRKGTVRCGMSAVRRNADWGGVADRAS